MKNLVEIHHYDVLKMFCVVIHKVFHIVINIIFHNYFDVYRE